MDLSATIGVHDDGIGEHAAERRNVACRRRLEEGFGDACPLFPFDGEARTCQRHMFPGSRCELTDSWRLTLKCRRDLRKRNREDVMQEERCSLQG